MDEKIFNSFNSSMSFQGFKKNTLQNADVQETKGTSVSCNLMKCNKIQTLKGDLSKKSYSEISKSSRELEVMRLDVKMQKAMIEIKKNEMKIEQEKERLKDQRIILELEHKIAEAELKSGSSKYSKSSQEEISHEDKMYHVQDWIDQVSEQKYENISSNVQNTQNQDNIIEKLCKTIEKTIQSTSKTDINQAIIQRQVLDKDFPYFDGNPENWPLFISQFRRKDDICQYTNDEKMVKLQRSLKGAALEAVKGMMLHPDNINLIIKTLEMRFGRPEYIIQSLLEKVYNYPLVKDGDFDGFIKFSCQVNNIVATLEQIGAKNHLDSSFIISQLVNKIPNIMKIHWGHTVNQTQRNNDEVTLRHFAEWSNSEASAMCCVNMPKLFTNNVPRRQYNSNQRQENLFYVQDTDKSEEICSYCKKLKHSITDCQIMKEDPVDKRWKNIIEEKLCFVCLKKGHLKNKCKSKKNCGKNGCKKRHHNMLHKDRYPDIQVQENLANHSLILQENNGVSVLNVNNQTSKVLLRILPVKLYGHNTCIETYALMDEGSTVSLIESDIAKKLGINGKIKPFCMQWANEIVKHNEDSLCMDIKMSGIYEGAKVLTLKNARTVKNLALPKQTIKMNEYFDKHLQGLPIKDMENAQPTILIGQDNISLTVPRKVYQGQISRPIATKTHLGWILHGNNGQNNEKIKFSVLHVCQASCDDNLDKMVRESFSTEAFGVTVKKTEINGKDKRAMELLEKTTTKIPGERRYETGLLWKRDDIILPESRSNALNRLICVERKMSKDKIYHEQYCNKFDDYIKKGYIKKLNKNDIKETHPRIWYLPHFGVINPNKPKLRLVFDAAARSNGTSLNENLLQGPDYLTSLPGVLMRFRRWKWGFCGDITEMFHQVRIRSEDCPSQRLLWRNGDQSKEVEEYEMQVMIFGASCSPCSAQYVKNLNAKQLTRYKHLAEDVESNFYVDDYLDSCTSEKDALKKVEDIIHLHREGGFEVVGWVSNSEKITEKFQSTILTKELNKSTTNRVLGIWWDVQSDNLQFKLNFHKIPEKVFNGEKVPTKREILKLIMSVFDPLGFCTNIVVKGRIILQHVWRSGIGWDDEISMNIFQNWLYWLEELKIIGTLQIPRCYSQSLSSTKQVEIHVFCDASEEAFAAVSYLRIVSQETIEVTLISSKARVTPLKPLSIPRLELQAALMGSRLLNTIKNELRLDIQKSYLWTDSKTVLHWIRGDGRNYKQFVAHRVGEIQELTSNDTWKYVPTGLNIADSATRFQSKTNLDVNSLWFRGPHFLSRPENDWPEQIDFEPLNSCHDEEKLTQYLFLEWVQEYSEILPDPNRFSKWIRLVRSTAWVQRFCNVLLNRLRNKDKNTLNELTVPEIETAEQELLKCSQAASFQEEICQLQNGYKVNTNSKIYPLCPFVDKNGLLRMDGRIKNGNCLGEDTKNPIILDSKNLITKLLLHYYHIQREHTGMETVLNDLRQKFWILKGRSAVQLTFKNCQYCKNKKVKPQVPMMGQLPEIRLTPGVKPFTYTGVDYFGPIYVSVGRHREKRWGVLFTCMTVRAIHLEIAHALTADGTIMALRRMIARRGTVKHIYSDNGTNFKGASEELKSFFTNLEKEKLTKKLTEKKIQWHFIPPGSPNMGGCWERLIGSVKKILQNTLKEVAPRDEVLLTIFSEAENIVNSRPLTHISIDPQDPECITPNHLLIGESCNNSSFQQTFEETNVKKLWKKSQYYVDQFWKRWVKDYLPTLTKRGKWINDAQPVNVGDLVILVDETFPRSSWPMGRIMKVFPGKDGKIRVIEVKTASGTYRRPVSKICKLQLEDGENS